MLRHQFRGFLPGESAILQQVLQICAFHKAGDDEPVAVLLANVEHCHNSRVLQLGQSSRFGDEFAELRLGPFRVRHLDGHASIECVVVSQVDFSKAALPNLAYDSVSPKSGCGSSGDSFLGFGRWRASIRRQKCFALRVGNSLGVTIGGIRRRL
jgi:hypothetical protein